MENLWKFRNSKLFGSIRQRYPKTKSERGSKGGYGALYIDGSSVSIENEHIVFNLVQPIESAEKSCFQYDKCAIDCSNEELNSVLNTVQNGEDGYYQSKSFWWILIFWVVGATAWNGVATLQDAIATQSVQDHYR